MSQMEPWRKSTSAVDGWFMEEAAAAWDALLCFQREAGLAGDLAEIGVFKGKSAALLALHRQGEERLTLIDLWFTKEARQLLGELAPASRWSELARRSSDLTGSPESAALARRCRFVHIDGGHSGEAVTADLALADLWLAQDGIICLDDFFNDMYPQLTAAVFRFLETHRYGLSLFLCGHNKGYLCRPTVAPRYLAYVATRLHADLVARGVPGVTICKTNAPSELNCFGIKPRFRDLDYYGLDEAPTIIRY